MGLKKLLALRKTVNIAFMTILTLMFAVTFFLLVYIFAGLKPMYVSSESMEPAFYKGDLVVQASLSELQENVSVGSVIAFKADWHNNDIVTHRVVKINDGDIVTKGDNNVVNDPNGITIDKVTGLIVGRVPLVGWLVMPAFVMILGGISIVLLIFEWLLKFQIAKAKKVLEMIDDEPNTAIDGISGEGANEVAFIAESPLLERLASRSSQ